MLRIFLLLVLLGSDAAEDKNKIHMLSRLMFKIKMQVISYGVKDCIRKVGFLILLKSTIKKKNSKIRKARTDASAEEMCLQAVFNSDYFWS